MHLDFTPLLLLPAVVVILAGALGRHAWRLRRLPGAAAFAVVAGSAAVWAAFSVLEFSSINLRDKLLWGDLQYLGIVAMPVAWFFLALDYSGRCSWLSVRRVLLLSFLPAVTLVLLWTNDHHLLMRTDARLDPGGLHPAVESAAGIWFWVHAAYGYALALAAAFILMDHARMVAPQFRGRPLILFGALVVPLAYSLWRVLAPGMLPLHDFTTALFGVSGVVLAWGVFRLHLFGLPPGTRHDLVENLDDGLIILDRSDRVLDTNRAARRLIGQESRRVLGRPLGEAWAPWRQIAGGCRSGPKGARLHLGENGGRREYEVEVSDLGGPGRPIGRVLRIRDVTERSIVEHDLRVQALTDGLTRLPNRTLLMAKIDDAVRQARRDRSTRFALAVLDLDRFKLINDNVGHLAGDFLLEEVAAKLRGCVRDVDVVARVGGDEFMILLRNVTTALDLLPVMERIRSDLKKPLYFDQHQISSSASIGIALWEDAYQGPEEVMRAADTAMYQAKASGGACYRIFDEEMHQKALQALQAKIELGIAVKCEDFALDYQPILDLSTGSICSLEALIRWHHPEHGVIMPGGFIKTAEDSGLIVPLGALALEKLCAQLSLWRGPECPTANLPVSLNISPQQLIDDDFVPTILACMDEWRVAPGGVILEISEAALIRDPAKTRRVMLALRDAGIRICLDNFGAGWSLLGHLTAFPIHCLKIDRSFVSKIAPGNVDFEIIKALAGLAHSVGLRVTGEGVERQAQMNLLAESGCDQAQGYFIGRPMPPDHLVYYLEEFRRRAGSPAEAALTAARALSDASPGGDTHPHTVRSPMHPGNPARLLSGSDLAPDGLA